MALKKDITLALAKYTTTPEDAAVQANFMLKCLKAYQKAAMNLLCTTKTKTKRSKKEKVVEEEETPKKIKKRRGKKSKKSE